MYNFINGRYQTEKRTVGFFSRKFPSLAFYYRLIIVIFKSSHLAKRRLYGDREWVSSSLDVKNALESVGVSINIEGVNNIKKIDGPCVFAGNHMSSFETFILPSIIQPIKSFTFVVKKELTEVPVFKHVMLSRNPIAVGRDNPRNDLVQMLEEGSEKLKNGISVFIFPQKTRRSGFVAEEFNSIAVKLAKKAGVPLIPVALKTDTWQNGKYLKDFGKIITSKKAYFSFSEPVYVKNRGVEEHELVISFIQNNMNMWNKD